MNIKIVKNKYINALFIMMLFSAIAHMLILFYLAIISADFYIINYFKILDLDSFFPGAFDNLIGGVSSILLLIVIYIIILKNNKD
ncbi:MAG: hypothetical protein HY219_01585 [Candidatus Staskawiczbacteria bacterium]|nr:hypothetical protein [Candidatus Staskawiczbacteria bacterium]